jgi:prolyl 4-hydroxylase
MFYINPLKEEVLYMKPRIAIYHDVMTESEISKLKELATPKLHRSGVFAKNTSGNVPRDYRTSQSGWINDSEHPLIDRLSQRTKALTNLTLDTVEEFQVLNYGIGGHYEPHYDFARPHEVTFEEYRGNRIATVIFYMSNVHAGGRTVFNKIGVGSMPEKGSCLVWFNLLQNGDGDYDTMHAGCPVLSGNKWVVNKWFHAVGQEFIRPCSLSSDE